MRKPRQVDYRIIVSQESGKRPQVRVVFDYSQGVPEPLADYEPEVQAAARRQARWDRWLGKDSVEERAALDGSKSLDKGLRSIVLEHFCIKRAREIVARKEREAEEALLKEAKRDMRQRQIKEEQQRRLRERAIGGKNDRER